MLHKGKCMSQCPELYRPNFDRTECEPETDITHIPFPLLTLVCFAAAAAYGGQYSSKNQVTKAHRKMLSFYAFLGLIDVLAILGQFVLTIIQGQLWMIPITLIPLCANGYINWLYKNLWDRLDPPKPEDEDDLNRKEVLLINDCDENFDKWNNKYFGAAGAIRTMTVFGSHKMFNLPFTHFFGYIHFTVRTQDCHCKWEWDEYEVQKWNLRRLSRDKVADPNFRYHGKLVPAAAAKNFAQEMAKDGEEAYEGGKKDKKALKDAEDFNPFDLVQHPSAYPRKAKDRKPDTRVADLYKKAVKIDLILIRFPLILSNSVMCLTYFLELSASQLYVQVLESIAISFIVMFCQWNIWRHWEEYRLDVKMKDTKANYLFISPKVPNQL